MADPGYQDTDAGRAEGNLRFSGYILDSIDAIQKNSFSLFGGTFTYRIQAVAAGPVSSAQNEQNVTGHNTESQCTPVKEKYSTVLFRSILT